MLWSYKITQVATPYFLYIGYIDQLLCISPHQGTCPLVSSRILYLISSLMLREKEGGNLGDRRVCCITLFHGFCEKTPHL
jgi:hypothetical protein